MSESLETRARALLASKTPPPNWRDTLQELLQRTLDQDHLLKRLTRIADRFQAVERDRAQGYLERYERKVRQLEKIVRISDQYQQMLHQLKERLEHASNFDPLTTLPNRRYMTQRLEEAAAHATRTIDAAFLVMLIDVDHFKTINDTYGHAVGDKVLQQLAQQLQHTLRDYDVCGRWGGEEFLLLVPSGAGVDGTTLAQRLCMAIAKSEPLDGVAMPTISIGFTAHVPGESVDATLLRADQALYMAKAQGRNCVCRL